MKGGVWIRQADGSRVPGKRNQKRVAEPLRGDAMDKAISDMEKARGTADPDVKAAKKAAVKGG